MLAIAFFQLILVVSTLQAQEHSETITKRNPSKNGARTITSKNGSTTVRPQFMCSNWEFRHEKVSTEIGDFNVSYASYKGSTKIDVIFPDGESMGETVGPPLFYDNYNRYIIEINYILRDPVNTIMYVISQPDRMPLEKLLRMTLILERARMRKVAVRAEDMAAGLGH